MYTCNGTPKGCERERFGHCNYCDSIRRDALEMHDIEAEFAELRRPFANDMTTLEFARWLIERHKSDATKSDEAWFAKRQLESSCDIIGNLYKAIEKFVAECELTNCHQNHQALCDLNKSLKDTRHQIRELERTLTPSLSGSDAES